MKPPVIFIGGTGRSGTNILKAILSEHSNTASLPFEYRFIIDPDGVIDFYNTFPTTWSPYMAEHRLKRLSDFLLSLAELSEAKQTRTKQAKATDPKGLHLTPPSYAGWELERWIPGYTSFIHEMMDALIEFSYPAIWPGAQEGVEQHQMLFAGSKTKDQLKPAIGKFINQCYQAVCDQQKKAFFVEDNTHNILFAKDLLDLTPQGILIHMVRDPRDVISSLLHQRWAPNSIDQLIAWYREVMTVWLHQRDQLQTDQFIELRFEDLVSEPSRALNHLCDFAGIPFEDSLLSVDLSQHNIGRYKEQLSAKDVAMIERELSAFIEVYNYQNPK